jgi:outer membrane biosynthesis protein TonB
MAKKKTKKKISAKSAIIAFASLAVVGSFIPSENSPELDSENDTQIVETTIEDTKQPEKEEAPEPQQEPESEQKPDSEPPEQTEPEKEPEPENQPEQEPDPEENTEPEPPEEPEPEPEIDPEQAFRDKLNQYNYVGSSDSDKYHKPKCRWTKEINDENLVHFDTEEEAAAAGYKPCGTCKP